MAYTREQIQSIFRSSFNQSEWTNMIINFFKAREVYRVNNPLDINPEEGRGSLLGYLDTQDGYRIGFFYLRLNRSIDRRKVGLRQMITQYIKIDSDAGIGVFDDGNHWRLSFITDLNGEKTAPKRYTFVFGDSENQYRTAVDRFMDLQKNGISFKNIKEAFSVEALSDSFFDEYKEHYLDFIQYITGKRIVKVGNNEWKEITVEGAKQDPSFSNAFKYKDGKELSDEDCAKRVRDYVKKMMGRLVFLCFLQRKGWMGNGDLQYLQHLYSDSSEEIQKDFLDRVLEPMFFGLLNTKPEEREEKFKSEGWDLSLIKDADNIPYLNGGLFEQDKDDNLRSVFPCELFSNPDASEIEKKYTKGDNFDYRQKRGLFDFFAAYNFTIDENDPDDAEVGVDPEMLGRIFENLLEDNKDKGAFYTPKEIVQYMCRESLTTYLTTCIIKQQGEQHQPEDKISEAVRKLLANPQEIVPRMTKQNFEDFGRYIREVKICDPAIGSGAFPMGLLNELVRCRVSINAWAKDEKGNALTGDYAALKADIICNNIYGVDIERGAIDIARLRFWLSIIVDEQTPHPLPNFDYKFMQGNSLIPTFCGEYIDLSKKKFAKSKKKSMTNKNQEYPEVQKQKKHLYELKKQYYVAYGDNKLELAIQIKDTILTLIALYIKSEMSSWVEAQSQTSMFGDAPVAVQYPPEKQKILDTGKAIRDRLHDESLSLKERAMTDIHFFDWRIMFTEVFDVKDEKGKYVGGFDIVIGNPPYVDIKGMPREDVKLYFNLYSTCEKRINLYAIFIENGMHLLSNTGILCFINPNSMLVNESYTKLRKLLIDKLSLIVKLPDSVFTDAVVETIIFMAKNNNYEEKIKGCFLHNNDKVDLTDLNYNCFDKNLWKDDSDVRFNIFINDEVAKLLAKIKKGSNPLGNYILTSLGITPYDKAKGHSKELIKSRGYHAKEKLDETYVPLISGKNISPYCISGEIDEYLKYGEWLGAPRERRFFVEPRIVVRQIVGGPTLRIIAGYADDMSTYFTQIGFSVISRNKDITELKFILALLNSKLLSFYHKNTYLDPEKVVFQKVLIANAKLLPIRITNDYSIFESLVNQILSAKKQDPHSDTTALETQIDRLVYELYGLTNAEVKIIDPEAQVTGTDNDLFKA